MTLSTSVGKEEKGNPHNGGDILGSTTVKNLNDKNKARGQFPRTAPCFLSFKKKASGHLKMSVFFHFTGHAFGNTAASSFLVILEIYFSESIIRTITKQVRMWHILLGSNITPRLRMQQATSEVVLQFLRVIHLVRKAFVWSFSSDAPRTARLTAKIASVRFQSLKFPITATGI